MRLNDGTEICDLDPDAGSVIETCSSDARLKENIRESKSVMYNLMDMHVRDFELKSSGETQIGFIAQELMMTHPELVSIDDDGYYMVSSLPQAKIIKAIQEQQYQIEHLKLQNDALKELEHLLKNTKGAS